MAWNFTTSQACIDKAGEGAASYSVLSFAALSRWNTQAENYLNTYTRYDWSANSSAISTNFKGVIEDFCSSWVARRMISYGMSGYMSRAEAQTILDVLTDDLNRTLSILKEEKNKEKLI